MASFPVWLKSNVFCAGEKRLASLASQLQTFLRDTFPNLAKTPKPLPQKPKVGTKKRPLERALDEIKELRDSGLSEMVPTAHSGNVKKIRKLLEDIQFRRGHACSKREDGSVPVVDLSAATSKELCFLLSLFSLQWDESDLTDASRDELLGLLLLFVPHKKPEAPAQASDRSTSSYCSTPSCKTSLGFWRRGQNCFACAKTFCSSCIRQLNSDPLLDVHSKTNVCNECYERSRGIQAKAWLDMGFQLINRQSMSSLYAASACLSFASSFDESIVTPLQIAKNLNKAGFHQLSLIVLLPIVEPVVLSTKEEYEPVQSIKALLLLSSVLIAWTSKEESFSDKERFCYLCAAKESFLQAVERQLMTETPIEIPDMNKKKEELDKLIQAADVYEKRCREHATRVGLKRSQLDAAWESREWDELWGLVTAPPDTNENLSESFYQTHKDSGLEALDVFLEQRVGFINQMRGDDQAGLRLLAGVAKTNEGNYVQGLHDIESAVWTGHHSEWLPNAAVKVFIAVFSIPAASHAIAHQTLFQNCVGLTPEILVSLASDSELIKCGLLPSLSMVFPPSTNRVWPDFWVRSSKTARKYEEGIAKNFSSGKWSHRDVALAYLDFMPACCHSSEIVITLLMAGSWFLKELDTKAKASDFAPRSERRQRSKIHPELYALKQSVLKCAEFAYQIFRQRLHPGMQFYVLRQCVGMVIHAIKLANQDFTEKESQLIVEMFRTLIYYARFCPFWHIPVVGISEAILLNIISGQLHSEYMLELQNVESPDSRPVSMQEVNYQIYENDLLHLSELVSSDDAYEKCAETLIRENGWTWEHVSDTMTSPLLPRTPDGWLVQEPKFAVDLDYAELYGFEIDVDSSSPSLRLLVKKPDSSNIGLFSQSDVAEAIRLNRKDPCLPVFSLDPPSPYERYHPFQKLWYKPDRIQGTGLLKAMLEADYLMKSFSVGSDISSKPPFKQRPTIIGDGSGLLDKLPRHVRSLLRPVRDRKWSPDSRAHRFWIQADELAYNRVANSSGSSKIVYHFKRPTMVVRTSPMIHDVDGKLIDAPQMDPDSPEMQFANDLTKNYDEIGAHFPIFLRLRELVKLMFVGRVIHGVIEGIKEQQSNAQVDEAVVIKIERENWRQNCDSVETLLRKMRNEIDSKGGIGAFVEGTFSNIVSQLDNACHYSVSRRELEGHVHRWLRSEKGSARRLSEFICSKKKLPTRDEIRSQCLDHIREEYRKKEKAFESALNSIVQKGSSCEFQWKSHSQWVPAALYKSSAEESLSLCYGGVTLVPKIRESPVRLPNTRIATVTASGRNQTNSSRRAPSYFNQASAFAAKSTTAASASSGGKSTTGLLAPAGGSGGNGSNNSRLSRGGEKSGNPQQKGSSSQASSKPPSPMKTRDLDKSTPRADAKIIDKKRDLYTGGKGSGPKHRDHVVEKQVVSFVVNEARKNNALRLIGQTRMKELKECLRDVFNRPVNQIPTFANVNRVKGAITRTCITAHVSGRNFDREAAVAKLRNLGVDWNTYREVWKEHAQSTASALRQELRGKGKVMQQAGEAILSYLDQFDRMMFG